MAIPTDGTNLILAIDLGTSGPKVALFTERARLIAVESEPAALHLLPGGGAEQDPHEWWRAIAAAARRLLAKTEAPPGKVAAVSATAQWGGTVAVDAQGEPVHDAIIWADTRGAAHVQRIAGGWPRIEGYGVSKLWPWIRRSGGIPTRGGKDPIAHILYLKHERPDLYRRTAHFLDIKDYLNLRLTGLVASSPDTITLHWVTDNRTVDRIDYDPVLLRLSGLDRATLPDLRPAASILGPLTPAAALDLGLAPGTPVAVSSGDIMAAAVGSGAVLDFQPHVHIGTSSWLSCHMPAKKTDLFHNMASLPSAIPGRYLLTNEQDVAGGTLVWLRDALFFAADSLATPVPEDVFARFDDLAARAPAGSNGALFTPWLNGERSPVEDRFVRGGFHNLSLRTTRADLVRAVLEGVALNTRWLLPHVEKLVGRQLGAIRMVGGGARSDLWCQIYADVLGRPIEQVEDAQACSGRGAALLAALALGTLAVHEIPEAVSVRRTFAPVGAHRAVYDTQFHAFRELYTRTRKLHLRLNGGRDPEG